MQNDLISTQEAAELCDRSYATITRWATLGKLKPVHKGAGLRGAYIFRRSDVLALADQKRVSA